MEMTMTFPRTPYDEEPEDAALLNRANMLYEMPVLEAISRTLNAAWDERNPEWRTAGRRVPPYVAGDYRRAIEAVQQVCAEGGSPLPAL